MRGDYSSWRNERGQNFNGVLHQQGRVLLDRDWNAQTAVTNDWQDTAGRDIMGSGVAAVPADAPDSFKIKAANIFGGQVQLTVAPGRAWADGLLAHLDGAADVTRVGTFLDPPIQTPAVNAGANGTRDAVVLEVWREEINGFQLPELLIEPALGGVDTTERVHTEMAFRLYRLTSPDDTCESIVVSLQDDFTKKGKLMVELEAPTVSAGDCPLAEGGGYTGFEHNLYRIEIAQVKSGLAPMFKWSQFGGGLVGRGKFDAVAKTLTINGNLQAIVNSGLQQFYIEALVFDPEPPAVGVGHWKVTYGAKVTLGSNDTITLPDPSISNNPDIIFGSIPPSTGNVFFRLWNGIAAIADFGDPQPKPLQDGILLKFDPVAGANYVAGDYWTFPVRAGEISNASPLVNNQPPEGIHYHRVPLSILSWSNPANPAEIEDCRRIFQPLTKLATCCSYRVGDGTHSHGDFTKIQEAINHLPAGGGEICVLPGKYEENITIGQNGHNHDITIKGCGSRSRIISATAANANASDPVIHVTESQNIRIESLAIIAHQKGVGVLLEGPDMQGDKGGTLRAITLEKLYIEAATRCAIEAHIGFAITIRGCDIEMSDEPSDATGIFLTGDDSAIEDNIIRVLSASAKKAGAISGGRTLDTSLFQPAQAGKGGLQIGGTSERVRILNNLIQGGIGNGITLGTVSETHDGQNFIVSYPGSKGIIDLCDPCKDTDSYQPPPKNDVGGASTISAGALHEIYIERNLIYNMGANGIGVVKFFDLEKQDEFISVQRLTITGNEIRACLFRPIAEIPQNMLNGMGYGGIVLADGEDLVIRDNIIESNGPSHLMPICGIFVLHGEGIEISRNRILNNGANDGKPAQQARLGARGGIYIVYGIAPRVPILHLGQGFNISAQNGVPAIKVHENIVSAPLGQALALVALGPVSVVGNQFTSLGVIVRSDSSTHGAATVLILNLGLSNELYWQLLAFSAVALGQVRNKTAYVVDGDTLVAPQPGLDDEVLGQYLANGNVLFSNNQCVLDLIDQIPETALSSILIASLDDVSFHDNQCDCDLFLGDRIFAQAILFGISLRANDNRFKEGVFGAWLSAMTFGILNMTTNNQSTHCLMIRGAMVEDQPNTVLITGADPQACALFDRVKQGFGKMWTGTR